MAAEDQGRAAAEAFRVEHGLGLQPLGDLVALIERTTGHDVAVLDAEAEEHGLTIHDPVRDATFIGVARTQHPMRQRSTLAHELAHVVFTDWQDGADLSARSPEEMRADAFARHLLVPLGGLRLFIDGRAAAAGGLTDADLSAAVQWFLASPSIVAIAMNEGGFIDVATKKHWMKETSPRLAARFGWSDQYRSLQEVSDRVRAPQRLLARAVEGYQTGVVSAQAVATLRGMRVDDVVSELAEVGISPREPEVPWLSAADLPAVDVDLSCLDDDRGDPTA